MQNNMHSFRTSARTITSTLPFAPAHPETAREHARPMLRLLHGSSDDADCFVHRARSPGAISTVGASLGCDWTVRAAGVPGVAFALRRDGGALSICPALDAHVFVDGRRQLPVWRTLRIGSRVDVGLLRVEVVSDLGVDEPSDVRHVAGREVGDQHVAGQELGGQPRGRAQAALVQPALAKAIEASPTGERGAASILGAEEEAQARAEGAEFALPTRFPWSLVAMLSASAALYLLTLSVLD